ncbi:hypothetical protein Bca52824_065240 [Brassica carinata]|uniref:Uncharacterized protein n=1 Tax=Brassica carinata TaxID=52824 RepID=A0A8X7QLD2_BRACI|nr:hypothetical protein Bca52824_065240 [Brassica carinata]
MRPKGRANQLRESSGSRLFKDERSSVGSKGPKMRLLQLSRTPLGCSQPHHGEESSIPIPGLAIASPTPPLEADGEDRTTVDLLELSDSSAEEEGGEKSDGGSRE